MTGRPFPPRLTGQALARVRARVRAALPSALTVAGLALLSASAWTLATSAGLAAAGVSCLLLEYLTRDEQPPGSPAG